ncbi:FAD-dependent oxidoreductase [Halobellus ordinarius]|uniref:FAD-dependent oxidoreductase n=1 Tax=Halobellus ordinarius TaxID=3075120 RepID=UPI0028805B69|nr:FAD-dependent oxidoreductase [Halobellus sp. ZY16]
MNATVAVTGVDDVGPETVALQLESPDGFDAVPGQFLKLSATIDGEEYGRFYTLSSPDVVETFEITVGVDPDEAGPFSRFLLDLEPGDAIEISGPFGQTFYDGESRVVVLAGGPGIGPAVGIAEAAVADGNEAAIVYRTDAPAHGDRLDALREAGASVFVAETDLADAVADAVTGSTDEQVFVYGFADFVDDALTALGATAADPEAAKVENFG